MHTMRELVGHCVGNHIVGLELVVIEAIANPDVNQMHRYPIFERYGAVVASALVLVATGSYHFDSVEVAIFSQRSSGPVTAATKLGH